MSDYHARFVAQAKKHLDKPTFEFLHHRAKSSAGGAAPRVMPADVPEEQPINKSSAWNALRDMWATTVKAMTGTDLVNKDASPPNADNDALGPTHIKTTDVKNKRRRPKNLLAVTACAELSRAINKSEGLAESDALAVHLGCGHAREPGAVGIDLVSHDDMTLPHDLSLGIPLPDGVASHVYVSKAALRRPGVNFNDLMLEAKRVCKPDAKIVTDFDLVEKKGTWNEDEHQRADDGKFGGSGGRGEANMSASHSRAQTARRSAEQSAERMRKLGKKINKQDPIEVIASIKKHRPGSATIPLDERLNALEKPRRDLVLKSLNGQAPIAGLNYDKHIMYGPALVPWERHHSGHVMTPEDIEYTAHGYLQKARVIGSEHTDAIDAAVVESFIAPCDLHFEEGPHGAQSIPKGSWVVGVKIHDDTHWQRVVDGEYTGFSTGGYGALGDWEET